MDFFQGGGCKFSFDLETFHRYLRSICTVCGAFSLFFLAITLFLYMTLPDLNNFQVQTQAKGENLGREPWSTGQGRRPKSELLWVQILVPDTVLTFFKLICCKIVMFVETEKLNCPQKAVLSFSTHNQHKITMGLTIAINVWKTILKRRSVISNRNSFHCLATKPFVLSKDLMQAFHT